MGVTSQEKTEIKSAIEIGEEIANSEQFVKQEVNN